MPNNGATKVYHGLDFATHQALAAQLLDVRAQLLAVQARVLAGYGRNDGKAKLAQKLVDTLDLLRGHCSHSLVHEHGEQLTRQLSMTYYPADHLLARAGGAWGAVEGEGDDEGEMHTH